MFSAKRLSSDEYGPIAEVSMEPTLRGVERRGFEPVTPWLQSLPQSPATGNDDGFATRNPAS